MSRWLNELKRGKLAGLLRRHVFAHVWRKRAVPEVAKFKTEFWQSRSGAETFMKGSDITETPAAGVMDAVINSFFLEHCPPRSKILDIGSGHGIVSLFLARHGHRVTACDVSEALLDVLAKSSSGLNIEIRKGEAHEIPAGNGEFDVIVARMFLGHFPDWPDILREMARCCRAGGKLLIHFTSRENAEFGQMHGRHRRCQFADSPDLDQRRVNPYNYFAAANEKEIRAICTKLDLQLLERAPNTFFLHNRLIGHSLGSENFNLYQQEVLERLKDEKVRDFAIWFENTVVRYLPAWASYYNVIVLQKGPKRREDAR